MDKVAMENEVTRQENSMVIIEKKSNLKANTFFDFKYLIREEAGLIPCRFQEEEEEVKFVFDMTDLTPLKDMENEPMVNKYRFLCNVKTLRPLYSEYSFALSESNIYYDNNYMPYILSRDILELQSVTAEENERHFFEEYKKLAAGVINKKYTCRQVQESGIEILKKDKEMTSVLEADSTEVLSQVLAEKWKEAARVIKDEKKLVDKKKYRTFQVMSIGVIIALVLGIVYTGYQVFYIMPVEKAVIQASKSYVIQDYPGCVEDLGTVSIDRMDTYTKYILAVSYAKNEMLKKEELNNIVEKLSIYSNEIELDYWIYLGRYEVEMAENIAKALSDDKLLIYAYMKEINMLENNVTIDGTEKQSRLTELNNQITNLGKKYLEQE